MTNTRCHTRHLLENKRLDPYIKQCLEDCLELYSDALPYVRQAIKEYRAKNYVDANIHISAAMDASTTCENGFKEKKGVVSPLTKRNKNTFQLSAIALSIMNMVG
ncbi:Pectinesterase inhibitor domain [Dillenia turbinata]|uniref:Pectinesterase inhibitor domain n=1 Tax=Dillenia turbinata TaxID=194707 RepID=A0AAN8UWK5_9MAGN